jgi:hypothetical protein
MERTCIICYKNYDDEVFIYRNVCSSKCEREKVKIENKFKNPKSFQELLIRLKYIKECNLIKLKKVTAVREIANFFKVFEFYNDLKNSNSNSPCNLKDAKKFYEEVIECGNII